MQRISTSSAVADLFGSGKSGFRNGDLPRGVLPTAFNAEWCNHVQEEICNVIEGAGVALNPDKRDQLLTALQKLIDNSTVKTSGSQNVGGEKTFTGTAFFKGGAFVSDSAGDFAANQCLQIGSNNVNSYFYNKRSGKYLSMRNDGELRYDGKRLLNTDDLSNMTPSGEKAANGWCRLPNGLIIQWGFKPAPTGRYDVTQSVVFPVTFPAACLNVSLTPSMNTYDTDHDTEFGVHSLSQSGFKFWTWLNPYLGHYWTAIGY